MIQKFVLLFVLVFSQVANAPPASLPPHFNQVGIFRYSELFLGIPQDQYDYIIRQNLERANAMIKLTKLIYSDSDYKFNVPAIDTLMANNPSFAPEIAGKLGDDLYIRFYGSDNWPMKGSNKLVDGELNGGNIGGPGEHLPLGLARIKNNPDLEYGTNQKWIDYIRDNAAVHLNRDIRTIVLFDETSAGVHSLIKLDPTFRIGSEAMHEIKQNYESMGLIWVSQYDHPPGTVFVEKDVLFVKDSENIKRKVDVLITKADVESIDGQWKEQLERNKTVGRTDYNRIARETGIQNLVSAWTKKKRGGFVWVNNPTSVLGRAKIFPPILDHFMNEVLKLDPKGLRSPETFFFADKIGRFSETKFRKFRRKAQELVFKQIVGEGGHQVTIGPQKTRQYLDKFFDEIKPLLKKNPYTFLVQPNVNLATVDLGRKYGERIYDYRVVILAGFDATNREPFLIQSPYIMSRIATADGQMSATKGGVGFGVPIIDSGKVRFVESGKIFPLVPKCFFLGTEI